MNPLDQLDVAIKALMSIATIKPEQHTDDLTAAINTANEALKAIGYDMAELTENNDGE